MFCKRPNKAFQASCFGDTSFYLITQRTAVKCRFIAICILQILVKFLIYNSIWHVQYVQVLWYQNSTEPKSLNGIIFREKREKA